MGVPTPIASIVAFPEFAEDNLVDGSFYRRILTSSFRIRISNEHDNRFLAYSDSDWAGYPVYRTSSTSYVVYLDSSPVSLSSKMQRFVFLSSVEAKYQAIASTISERYWQTILLHELRFPISTTAQIFCDNVSTK
ncbi:secreted RxLR effector protein 161-like [Solanum lycopersicum]|uniref:secreted RxLR effector protein 161-like n=1 Tax=Solanum lycopersicum TaxID=4081 RepID=UPI00374A5A4D